MWRPRILASLAVLSLWGALATVPDVRAQSLPTMNEEQPVSLRADNVEYDRPRDMFIATGNVEITQGARVIRADRLAYNRRDGVVTAEGNVSMLRETGDVIFADYVQLDQRLTSGVVRRIQALLVDKSRFAAEEGRREGTVTELDDVSYTACEICKEDPTRPPLWQLRARKVEHDETTRDITYRDARLELFGVPVAYLPFFRHPDPTVKRRTGLLVPSYGTSTVLGTRIDLPVFIALEPTWDATLTPIYTSREGPALSTEYRQLFDDGRMNVIGSIANSTDSTLPDRSVRGHIDANGRFDLADGWRWGFDAARASDDTYLRVYDISNTDTLTTTAFVERLEERSYLRATGYRFQGLTQEDDSDVIPMILPLAEYHRSFAPDADGNQWAIDASVAGLSRDEGADSYRLSLGGGWQNIHYGASGSVYTFSAQLRGDGYHVNDVATDGGEEDGFTGRIQPEASVDWRLPLVRDEGGVRQLVEPIVNMVVSPYGGNPGDIPNEDSRDFEFDDTNLFGSRRFPGYDRVEGGPRINYGVKLGLFGDGTHATALVGQSYRYKADSTFAAGTGLEDNFSDFVGRIDVVPAHWLNVAYRFRFDKDDLAPRRNDIGASANYEGLTFGLNYVLLEEDQRAVDGLPDREEISANAYYRIDEDWAVFGNARRDLQNDTSIEHGFGVVFETANCLTLRTQVKRTFTEDRDLRPSTNVTLRVALRTLGD